MQLSIDEYKDILSYYDIDFSNKTKKQIYITAENILANKLCKCIQKVKKSLSKTKKSRTKKNTQTAVAICKDSVLAKKGITIQKFKCKDKARFISNKTRKIFKL